MSGPERLRDNPLRRVIAIATGVSVTLVVASLVVVCGPGIGLLTPLAPLITVIDLTRPPGARTRGTGTMVLLALGLVAGGVSLVNSGDPIPASAWLTACCLLGLQLRAVAAEAFRACLLLAAGATLLVLAVEPATAVVVLVLATWAVVITAVVMLSHLVRQTHGPTGRRPAQAQVVGAAASGPVAGAARRALAPVAAVLALALAVFLLVPEPTGLSRLRPGGGGTGASSATGRAMGAYTGGDLDLSLRGDLPAVEVARVPANSPLYWRMNVLDTYDGTRWTATTTAAEAPTVEPSAGDATYTVEPRRGYSGVLMAPGPVVAVTPQVGRPVSAYKTIQASMRPFDVTVRGYPSITSGTPAPASDSGADDPTDPRWTRLPDGVSGRTRDLAVQIAGRGDPEPAAAAVAIEQYLMSGQFRYDLNAPAAPRGQDSVDHFLFTSRSGFCEHYAAAEVVLLRSLGVPARVATGFAGGKDVGDVRSITGQQAHAWVEVSVPGQGWLSSDATPSASPTTQWLSRQWVQRIIGVLLLAAVVVILVLMRRRRSGPLVTPAASGASRDPIVLALDRLVAAMEVAGVPNPPGQTIAETARLLPNAADALAIAERHLYGHRAVPRPELLQAVDVLDAATASLLRLSAPVPAGKRA